MVFFKKIVDWYIDSSLHVALAAYAFILLTFTSLNSSYDCDVAYFGFFGTIVAYNCIKYYRVISFDTKFYGFVCSITILSFFASIYYYIQLQMASQIVICLAFLITLLYTFSFFGILKPARNWIGFKVFLVALSWTLVTFLLPVVALEMTISEIVVLQAVQRFVLIYALMCIFEIIDLQFDTIGLQTLPQRIGIANTKKFGYFLLMVFIGIDVVIQSEMLLLNLFFILVIAGFLYYSNEKRSKYYSSFWVESIPIFWWLAQKLLTYF
jgi:hypothetical protein